MKDFPIKKLTKEYWPSKLLEIPLKPKILYYRGEIPEIENKFLCIIGSRKQTEYGTEVCKKLISGLKGFPINIVSGLAYGIDSIAHKCALENNLKTLAFPGSGLNENVLYPKTHFNLAKEILERGGTLLSEFENNVLANKWTFPKRNRLMAGISDAVLVIEAGQKSGTMITAYLALDYNRNVLAVPGSILNSNSFGTNNLIKEGAIPITCSQDILNALNFKNEEINLLSSITKMKDLKLLEKDLSNLEKKIINILQEPLSFEKIFKKISAPTNIIIQNLTELEMKNLICKVDGFYYKILPK